jgi:DNA polymerase I-like protein with 3'-5' exonuclease and polymerase domains
MVQPKDRFLIDTAFMVERTQKTFFETPLLTIDGKDYPWTFGFARDFLRMRRRLGIRHSVFVIGKDSHVLASEQQLHDVMDFLQRFELPYVNDPLHSNLQIIAALCPSFSRIVTADQRLFHLASDHLLIVRPQAGRPDKYDSSSYVSPEVMHTELGIAPPDVPTYLTLTEGFGAAKLTHSQAVRLIELYGDLEAIYMHLSQLTSPHRHKKLTDNEAQARRYYGESQPERRLEPTQYHLSNDALNLNTERHRQLLHTYRFHSLCVLLEEPPEVRLTQKGSKRSTDAYYTVVDRTAMTGLASLVRASKVCAIDTESDDKDPRQGTLFGVSFSVKPGEAYFVPLIENDLKEVSKDEVLQFLKELCASEIDFLGHNIKYDALLLRRHGIRIKSLHFDTMLAAYDCHGDWDFFNLRDLSQKLLGQDITSYADLVEPNHTFLDFPFQVMGHHACQDADMAMRLYPVLVDQRQERGITEQYYNDTMPLLKRLYDLEYTGLPVHEQQLNTLRTMLIERAVRLKDVLYTAWGKTFDLDAQTDLSAMLRDRLELRHIGSQAIPLSVLEQLAISTPIIRSIVQYKRLRRQIKAVESISGAIRGQRVHPLFKQIRSPAGRISSTTPSLFDMEALPELRSSFDRSIEDYFPDKHRSLAILAEVTQDPGLQSVQRSHSTIDPCMAQHPVMHDLAHDELLLSFVLGHTDASLSRQFFLDQLTVATLRQDLEARYRTLCAWLAHFQKQAERNGYAMHDGKRKDIDGFRSADLAKRRRALEYAVRWLIRW